jgi:hypothetical protein
MMRKWKKIILFVIFVVVLALFASGLSTAFAQSGYQINWWTVDGGGGESAGGGYTLKGTIGQHDAGYLEGEGYSLRGGFWVKGIQAMVEFIVNLPLVLR